MGDISRAMGVIKAINDTGGELSINHLIATFEDVRAEAPRIEPDLYSHDHVIDEELLKERRVQWCRQCGAIYGPNGFSRPKLHTRLSDTWTSANDPQRTETAPAEKKGTER